MGFFSWECAVSKKDIMNRHTRQGATPCVLVRPDDSVIEEDDYDGYGVFCGIDAYAELVRMNDVNEDIDKDIDDRYLRDQGIEMAFSKKPPQFPLKFVLKEFYTGQKYAELEASALADGQGFWQSDKR